MMIEEAVFDKGLAYLGTVPSEGNSVIRTDDHNVHIVKKRQAIRPNSRLRLVPLAMRQINASVCSWLIPHLPPASANE